MEETNQYDLIIAGSGIAGILCAARISYNHPGCSILLLDKEPVPGGRIAKNTTGMESGGTFTSGLSLVSPSLLDYMLHSLSATDPDQQGPGPEEFPKVSKVTVLSAGKFLSFPWEKWFEPECLKIFGGGAAVREWDKVREVLPGDEQQVKETSFSRLWKAGKKSAAATFLKNISPLIGSPDPLPLSTLALGEKLAGLRQGYHTGPWHCFWEQTSQSRGNVKTATDCRIVEAGYNDNIWELQTEKGMFSGKKLIVAQPPWDAVNWLSQSQLPRPVLQLAMKSRPVSVVVLSLRGLVPAESPGDLTLIPSEECYSIRNGDQTLCLHAVIDYEQSLDAPTVVKAIRRLRRARKKLEKAVPGMNLEKEHLALLPAAWTQSGVVGEKKFLEKLSDQRFQMPFLSFAGDAYGPAWTPDENLIKSVSSACDQVSSDLALPTDQEGA